MQVVHLQVVQVGGSRGLLERMEPAEELLF
jgi:hypothetical protein